MKHEIVEKFVSSTSAFRVAKCETNGLTYRFFICGDMAYLATDTEFVTAVPVREIETVAIRLENKDYTDLFAESYRGKIWETHYPILFATEIYWQDSDSGIRPDTREWDAMPIAERKSIEDKTYGAWKAYWAR